MQSPILAARSHTSLEEIDYVYLVTTLQNWAAPRNIISRLVQKGDLIRVKKGIYLFGPSYAKRPFSLEILANKIYGPSYISTEYALSFWGLIPEFVAEVTSMTTGKGKFFSTPVGQFSYLHLEPAKFAVGVTYIKISDNSGALMATPEKALIDLLIKRKEKSKDLERVLFEDLRLDKEAFSKLSISTFQDIENIYPTPLIKKIIHLRNEATTHA